MCGYDYLMFGRFQKKDRLSIFSLECLCLEALSIKGPGCPKDSLGLLQLIDQLCHWLKYGASLRKSLYFFQ